MIPQAECYQKHFMLVCEASVLKLSPVFQRIDRRVVDSKIRKTDLRHSCPSLYSSKRYFNSVKVYSFYLPNVM